VAAAGTSLRRIWRPEEGAAMVAAIVKVEAATAAAVVATTATTTTTTTAVVVAAAEVAGVSRFNRACSARSAARKDTLPSAASRGMMPHIRRHKSWRLQPQRPTME
jgi:hypothetical protein